ncbi:ATP-binding protein [Amycolatopsis jiangsuensis]|uniref:Anti-sigma regulatory factor (Ser/Thr protein kinase) n=1 Tax=Amycolatopsis jiangsuensis TaxID=1181879 RepID=A0A840J804_9PSEU|nr:ATP-binding protein [Amycolatopsis jiangsuensis]MBB4689518.1 anti-sigma regulatory factor (Ser/Thr protein kinase) [Amycolatopsis jiangsuensis]
MADPDWGYDSAPWVMDLRGTGLPALGRLRGWARRSLAHLGPDHLADVLVVVEEITANACEHTAGPSWARLTVLSHPCLVVIEVDDPERRRPFLRQPDRSSLRGRGMLLVDRLTDAWGVHDNPDGKTVWARLGCGTALLDPCHDAQHS